MSGQMPECDCGSTSWRHHQSFCPARTGVPNCGLCGDFHTGRCAETYNRCCDPRLETLDHRCRNCPGVPHAA